MLITSVLFALWHLNPWHFFAPLFFGIVVGVLTFRTGSTIPAMIAHASGNATVTTINYFFHNNRIGLLIDDTLAAVFVVVFLIYLEKTKHQAPPPSPLAFAPAGLSRRVLAAAMAGAVLFVGLALIVFYNWLGWHSVTAREEVLGLHRGDYVLLLRGPLARIGLADGELIEFELDRHSRLGRVEHSDSTHVWLVGRPADRPFEWQEIIGRAIRISTGSD